MLYYTEICLSPYEVPGYNTLCIYISGCCNRCRNCHYPLLQQHNYGDPLIGNFREILHLYLNQATCVCFLGEGANTSVEHDEFRKMVRIAQKCHLKTCLYSGRDTHIEAWMEIFDFIKLGSYREELGGLESTNTNQSFFEKCGDRYTNITKVFWEQEFTVTEVSSNTK